MKWVLMTALTGLAVLPIGAVQAQELDFDIGYTIDCLDAAADTSEKRQCIGKAADACMINTPGGDSTYGMGGCLSKEGEWWDARLNDAYKVLMRKEKIHDRDNGAGSNGIQSAADSLKAAQRAWIPFRDATCQYEYSQWGGGTGGGPASAACFMRMTAEQTLYLESAGFGG